VCAEPEKLYERAWAEGPQSGQEFISVGVDKFLCHEGYVLATKALVSDMVARGGLGAHG